MDGILDVESTPGKGSTFWVELDLPAIDALAQTPLSPRRIVGFEGPGRRILVVDDKAENRAVLVDMLKPLGFEIEEAEDGQAALTSATALAPDLVLMDLVMPVMDGFEAARQIRRAPGLKDVVVIALSASVFEHSRQRSREAGCDAFIPKPVKAGLLLDTMQEHLGLEWIYAEETPRNGAPDEAASETPPLVAPAADQTKTLHDLAMSGDIHGIRRQLDLIENLGDEYRPFVAALRRMADDYDMQQINDFVKPFLKT